MSAEVLAGPPSSVPARAGRMHLISARIISARTAEQLSEFLSGVQLRLSGDELRRLTDAGALTAMSDSDTQPVD